VYLTGGPQNHNNPGLVPNGLYYFQVTDPSGAVLLSTDPISCRQVQVTGGRIVAAAGSCPHAIGTPNSANGNTPVQLIPFDDTPNPGGEYKAWITPVAAYDSDNCVRNDSHHGTGDFGFCDSESKTDNFKVKKAGAAFVTVCKFNDLDGNGTQDEGEPLIAHWPITATGVDHGPVDTQTDDNGCVSFAVSGFNSGHTTQDVTLTEGTFGPDWEQTAPPLGTCGTNCSVSGDSLHRVINLTLSDGNNVTAPYFGNHDRFCETEECNPGSLVVTKDAHPRLTRTYKWDIEKDVNKTEIHTSGSSATFDYTVSVTHDSGTDSDWMVNGTIRLANPGGSAITNVTVTDAVNNGGVCVLTSGGPSNDGVGVDIPAGSHVDVTYSCTYASAPGPVAGTNTASNSFDSHTGTAAFDFSAATPQVVNGSVSVTDSLEGSLGTVSYTDASPTEYTYSRTFDGVAGKCKSYDNTATITETEQSSSRTVTVCRGADLIVSKTASPSFTRTYNWSIEKLVDKTKVEQAGGSATFNYTVNAKETGYTDSGWQVNGKITVTNLNDWEDIVADVSDAISNDGSCTVTGGTGVTVLRSSSVELPYSCTYASAPSPAAFTNTGTAGWDGSAASTPSSSASGTKDSAFGSPTTLVNKTIKVTDTFNSVTTTLGYLIATDATPYTSQSYTYSHTVTNTTGGACRTYTNTAIITQTGQSASQSVTICNTATGALTMGFWQNKNGQGIITGQAATGVCPSGTWLRQYAPFQDLSATATCAQVGTYVTNIIKAANASGAAMNAMLKAQMLATALDVYFSDLALGTNKIGAAAPIGGVKIDLTQICKMTDSTAGAGTCSGVSSNASSVFGGATSLTVSQLLTYAATQSNAGGSVWYGQVKATQELAKNTFDAINNQVALIAIAP
jgi:hypothetical protein